MLDGQMAQMEALYRSHGPALLRYLQRSFGSHADAEDLLQETFVRALSGGDDWPQVRSPRAFLFGVARHVGLTVARRAKLRSTEPLTDVAAAEAGGEQVDGRICQIRAAIARLPEQIRQTLELRLHDELSYEEVAMVLEIPVGTVRSRLHSAMRMLRDEMETRNEMEKSS
jgi:RNA polymerase sigma-70 factor (ECF subfamily)